MQLASLRREATNQPSGLSAKITSENPTRRSNPVHAPPRAVTPRSKRAWDVPGSMPTQNSGIFSGAGILFFEKRAPFRPDWPNAAHRRRRRPQPSAHRRERCVHKCRGSCDASSWRTRWGPVAVRYRAVPRCWTICGRYSRWSGSCWRSRPRSPSPQTMRRRDEEKPLPRAGQKRSRHASDQCRNPH